MGNAAIIRGLTLHRPWCYAIAHLGKDIENRGWNPTWIIGSYIAIHSGQKWDTAGQWFVPTLTGVEVTRQMCPPGQIIAVARVADLVQEHQSRWFAGDGVFGWVLDTVVALPQPVPCKGAQGLWPIPEGPLSQVREQWRMAMEGITCG